MIRSLVIQETYLGAREPWYRRHDSIYNVNKRYSVSVTFFHLSSDESWSKICKKKNLTFIVSIPVEVDETFLQYVMKTT